MKEDNKMHLRNSAKEALLQVLPRYQAYYDILGEEESQNITTSVTNQILNTAHTIYDMDCGINPTLIYSFAIENMMNKKLCRLCNEGNIEIEIQLVEQYRDVASFIIKRLLNDKVKEEFINNVFSELSGIVEDSLINAAIEDYQKTRLVNETLKGLVDDNFFSDMNDKALKKLSENLVMETIERYDGSDTFRVFMGAIAKEHKYAKRLTK